MGCLNPSIGADPEPNTGFISETFRLAESEVLKHAQIHSEQRRRLERISAETEWPCRKGKSVAPIRVKPRHWVHGPATSQCQNRRHLNMTERLREPSRVF